MVDLVKLRKKAKERGERRAESGEERAGERAAGGSRLAEETARASESGGEAAGGPQSPDSAEFIAANPAPASCHPEAGAGAERRSTAKDPLRNSDGDLSMRSGANAPSPSQDDKVDRQRGNPTTASPTTDNRQPTPQSTKLEQFKTDAGKLRQTIEQAPEAQPNTNTLELLTFVIAGEHYAVDIERIVEIVRPRSVTRVPNADTSIVGIVSLRGTIVTLVDVRKRLRHAVAEETPDTRIIVVDHQGETIGFEVDRVLRVVKIGRGDVGGHPVVHASEADDCIRGVFRHAGALTILLDFDKLLALPHGNHL
jgi:purine-binding chemotaxis protein CheW